MADLLVCHLGRLSYAEGLALQERVAAARREDAIEDVLLLLEHDPVYTRGRRTGAEELPMGVDWYRSQGIEVHDTPRGGKATYHGPGQLVGYPIMRTDDVLDHVRTMERAMVRALAEEGLAARARVEDGPDFTGVWVGERKIASIGVHLAKGVTTHGFAVNVDNDLQPFEWIVPCGLQAQMTSVCREKGSAPNLPCFRKRMAHAFASEHGRRQRLVSADRLLTRALQRV